MPRKNERLDQKEPDQWDDFTKTLQEEWKVKVKDKTSRERRRPPRR